jgi:hypothetical protein
MSVTFKESEHSHFQVLSKKVTDWLRVRKEILRLTSSDGEISSKPGLVDIGILLPSGKRSEPIFAGVLSLNLGKSWEFQLYGRENQPVMTDVMSDLSREFDVKIEIILASEYSQAPWHMGGCANVIAAFAVIISAAVAVFI